MHDQTQKASVDFRFVSLNLILKKIHGYYFAMKILLFIILGHISIKKKFVISISSSIIFW